MGTVQSRAARAVPENEQPAVEGHQDIWAAVETCDVHGVLHLVEELPQRATVVRPTDLRTPLHVAASVPTQNAGTDMQLRNIMSILVNEPPRLEPGHPGADVHAVDGEGNTPMRLLQLMPDSMTDARILFLADAMQ